MNIGHTSSLNLHRVTAIDIARDPGRDGHWITITFKMKDGYGPCDKTTVFHECDLTAFYDGNPPEISISRCLLPSTVAEEI